MAGGSDNMFRGGFFSRDLWGNKVVHMYIYVRIVPIQNQVKIVFIYVYMKYTIVFYT